MRPISRPLRGTEVNLYPKPAIQIAHLSALMQHRPNTALAKDPRSTLPTRAYATIRQTPVNYSETHVPANRHESKYDTASRYSRILIHHVVRLSSPSRSLVPCPYTAGTQFALRFRAEDGSPDALINVVVVQAYSPFTLAQAMLVQRTQPHPTLPLRFVLKAVDPRFAEPDVVGLNRTPGWTVRCDQAFNHGLAKVRSGEWTNYWQCLGAERTRDISNDDLSRRLNRERAYWMEEMMRWDSLRRAVEVETTAYRALHTLQGSGIPRLYGSCVVLLDKTTPNLDPFVGNVPGLVLQHIEGTSLARLTIGKDLSVSDAERVSRGALAVLRKIRDALVLHGDFAARNIIVRPHDLDHPALIDFGSATTNTDGSCTQEQWIQGIANDMEVLRARNLLSREGLYSPSPMPEFYHYLATVFGCCGYKQLNRDVEAMRPEWRDRYYEPISDVPPDKVTIYKDRGEYRWEYPRWRIKEGVDTTTASADYMWGKKKPQVPQP